MYPATDLNYVVCVYIYILRTVNTQREWHDQSRPRELKVPEHNGQPLNFESS